MIKEAEKYKKICLVLKSINENENITLYQLNSKLNMNIGTIRQICFFLNKVGLVAVEKNMQSNITFTYNMKITSIGIVCVKNLEIEKIIN